MKTTTYAPRSPRREGGINPGRLLAVRALLAIEKGSHAQEALHECSQPTRMGFELNPGKSSPPPFHIDAADRALAWNLVLGVLRNRPLLDMTITTTARRTLQNLEPAVIAILRYACYELRFTRVPPHAAVDQAVQCSRHFQVGHASAFINAVLRHQHEIDPARLGLSDYARQGFPDWLGFRWTDRYGEDTALAWMKTCNEPAPVHLVARDDLAGISRAFQHQGIVLQPLGGENAPAGCARLPAQSGSVEDLPGFSEGQWWIMDPAAVQVADLVPESCKDVLDTCASPGGKTFRMIASGHTVTSTDVAKRLDRMRENAGRLGMEPELLAHNWEEGPLLGSDGTPRTFSAVLVDAPCSSLGLCRKHPDVRWHRHALQLQDLSFRQKRILKHAAMCVAPGGRLIYAVCSPEPDEGKDVVAVLLAEGWELEAELAIPPGPEVSDLFWAARLKAPA